MASLQERSGPKGTRYVIQVYDRDERRRSIGLGRIQKRQAEEICRRVEAILSSRDTGEPLDPISAAWLRNVGPSLRLRLEKAGVIEQAAISNRLGPFLDSYVAGRSDVKQSTTLVLGHTKRCLIEHFGADRPLTSITRGDKEAWRLWLLRPKKDDGQGLADNTARRRCGIARQYFNAAKKHKLIVENPADELPITVRGSVKKRFMVTRAMAQAVLDACPDAEWRALFALARWGGLRVPSEAAQLQWSDIDWERSKIRVTSPKTEHHVGGEERIIPLFPELRETLLEAMSVAETGSTHVMTRYRRPGQNVNPQLRRIIKRAGLKPWPKLWVNLRATRATEIFSEYPRHVGEAWLGHCFDVATEHYLSVSDDHFDQAKSAACAICVRSGAIESDRAQHGPAFSERESGRIAPDREKEKGNWALQDLNL